MEAVIAWLSFEISWRDALVFGVGREPGLWGMESEIAWLRREVSYGPKS